MMGQDPNVNSLMFSVGLQAAVWVVNNFWILRAAIDVNSPLGHRAHCTVSRLKCTCLYEIATPAEAECCH